MDRLEKRLNISRRMRLEEIVHGYDEEDLRSLEPMAGDIIEIYSEGNYVKIPAIDALPIGKLASLIEEEPLDQHSVSKLIKIARKLVRYKPSSTNYTLTSGSMIDLGDAFAQNVAGYPESALLIAMVINYRAKALKSDENAHCTQGYIFKKGKRINSSAIYVVYGAGRNKYLIDPYDGRFIHVNDYSVSFGTGKGHAQIFEDFSGNIVAVSQYSALFRLKR